LASYRRRWESLFRRKRNAARLLLTSGPRGRRRFVVEERVVAKVRVRPRRLRNAGFSARVVARASGLPGRIAMLRGVGVRMIARRRVWTLALRMDLNGVRAPGFDETAVVRVRKREAVRSTIVLIAEQKSPMFEVDLNEANGVHEVRSHDDVEDRRDPTRSLDDVEGMRENGSGKEEPGTGCAYQWNRRERIDLANVRGTLRSERADRDVEAVGGSLGNDADFCSGVDKNLRPDDSQVGQDP
jgi:hypothetical protein